jgi:hypothetical protein
MHLAYIMAMKGCDGESKRVRANRERRPQTASLLGQYLAEVHS